MQRHLGAEINDVLIKSCLVGMCVCGRFLIETRFYAVPAFCTGDFPCILLYTVYCIYIHDAFWNVVFQKSKWLCVCTILKYIPIVMLARACKYFRATEPQNPDLGFYALAHRQSCTRGGILGLAEVRVHFNSRASASEAEKERWLITI